LDSLNQIPKPQSPNLGLDIQVNLAELEKAVSSGADIDLGDPYCEGFKALHFLAFKASTEG